MAEPALTHEALAALVRTLGPGTWTRVTRLRPGDRVLHSGELRTVLLMDPLPRDVDRAPSVRVHLDVTAVDIRDDSFWWRAEVADAR